MAKNRSYRRKRNRTGRLGRTSARHTDAQLVTDVHRGRNYDPEHTARTRNEQRLKHSCIALIEEIVANEQRVLVEFILANDKTPHAWIRAMIGVLNDNIRGLEIARRKLAVKTVYCVPPELKGKVPENVSQD